MTTQIGDPPRNADAIRAEMKARLAFLRPLVHEYERLSDADLALDQALPKRQPMRSSRVRRVRHQPGTRGRPPGQGQRAQQAVAIVEAHPQGVSLATIADIMGIKPNYLYRVLPPLVGSGRLVKQNRLYYPTDPKD